MEPLVIEYGHAIISVMIVAVMALLLGPVSGRAKSNAGLAAGEIPDADYGDKVYRLHRAAQNMTEFFPIFASVVVVAILTGVDPFWANSLASVVFVSRLVHVVIHVGGYGAMSSGLRSMAFIIGWLASLVMAMMSIARVIAI